MKDTKNTPFGLEKVVKGISTWTTYLGHLVSRRKLLFRCQIEEGIGIDAIGENLDHRTQVGGEKQSYQCDNRANNHTNDVQSNRSNIPRSQQNSCRNEQQQDNLEEDPKGNNTHQDGDENRSLPVHHDQLRTLGNGGHHPLPVDNDVEVGIGEEQGHNKAQDDQNNENRY